MEDKALVEVGDPADEDRAVALAGHVDARLVGRPDVPELVAVVAADGDRSLEDVLADAVRDLGELAMAGFTVTRRPVAAERRR